MATNLNAGLAQWKLRRNAQRALGVLARHREAHAALRVLETTFVPTANEYIAVYDNVQVHPAKRGLSRQTQSTSVAALNKRTRMWLALLRRDVRSLVTTDIKWHASVADDVIASARRVISVASQPGNGGTALAYAAELTADLNDALAAAEAEWNGARTESSEQGDQQERLRELTDTFQNELVALRSALAAAIGKGHADYQLLRNPRTRSTTDDEDVANDNDNDSGNGNAATG